MIPKGTKLLPRFFTLKEIDNTNPKVTYIHSFEEMVDSYAKNELVNASYLNKEDVASIPPPELLDTDSSWLSSNLL